MAYMQRITSAAASRPAVRQALQKATNNSCNSISSVPKRNYWGHRYHVVPVDGNVILLSTKLINQNNLIFKTSKISQPTL